MMAYVHVPCAASATCLSPPDEDPDRWGNVRHTYQCDACGERDTVLTARHGGRRFGSIKPADSVDWTVAL